MRLVKGLLDRCLKTIELLAINPQWQRLSDIADRLEIQKSPTHRLLNELVNYGWIEQDLATDRYRLTLKFSMLGQQYLYGTGLPGLVQPILDEIAGRCRELVRLTVIDGQDLFWFAASQGAAPGLMYQPNMLGKVVLHTTANGKAWLATMDDQDAVRHAQRTGLGKKGSFGPRALTNTESLIKELGLTRKRGYGVSNEEAERGVNAIAVALRLPSDDQVVGTISVAGPSQRLDKERFSEIYRMLSSAASKLVMVWPLKKAASVMGESATQVLATSQR